jgi:anti-anti-sigma factor
LLTVQGEVDLATAPELQAALESALPPERARVVIDLRGVTFLDSTGLALLLRYDRKAALAGRRVVVVKGPPQVQRAFELTGLSQRLTMVDEPPE